MNIRDYLQESILIMDGAMGTYYDLLYHGEETLAEEANMTRPERVRKIHKEYINQGARLLRTNTFALNKASVEQIDTKGLSDENYIRKNLSEAVKIARQAVEETKKPVYIGADIGPIPEREDRDVEKEYEFLVDLFLQEGIDIFVFETFPDTKQVKKAAAYIREKNPDAFILAQFTVNPTGYSQMGHSVGRILKEAGEMEELDACGLNCGIGVSHMRHFLKQNGIPGGKWFSAVPNCGYPKIERGRTIYSDSESYYGDRMGQILSLGVNIIGGCCGTTPSYIGELSKRFAGHCPSPRKTDGNYLSDIKEMAPQYPMIEKMNRGKKVIAVELDPPFNEDMSKMMEGAYYLKERGVDMITIADSPMARSRADALLVASRLGKDVRIPVIPHFTCRDRNRINIRSTILGAYLNDIRNILVVTGDPIDRADKEHTTGVFDFNSIRLMEFIQGMNEEHFGRDPICIGGALNQNGACLSAIAKRMQKKIDAGASFFLTQPIYDEEGIERIRQLKEQVDTKILCGIMPLVSYRNAMFIHNEMPGIQVPEQIVERYRPDMTKEEAEQTAVEISLDLMKRLETVADGYYFMTPFNRVSLIGRIIEENRKKRAKND